MMNLDILENTGLLFAIFPELEGLDKVEQDPIYHKEGDVLTHTKLVLAGLPKTPEFFFAGLFHDVGKKDTTVVQDNGRITAYGHEKVSADVVSNVLRRLKVSNSFHDEVVFLVRHHMKAHCFQTTKRTLRRLVREGGFELVEKLIVFGMADTLAGVKDVAVVERLQKELEELKQAPAQVVATVLNGVEVMNLLGLESGPEVGAVLRSLQDFQDDKGEITREEAEEFVRSLK
jgi:tRNA nucleotidyltransferase (CCA-adding enzyme)